MRYAHNCIHNLKGTLHPDHMTLEGLRRTQNRDGTWDGFPVTFKSLRDFDIKSYMYLKEIRKICHPNLIRPLAAIDDGQNYSIMFEWADNGSLRNIWNDQGESPRNLTADRITCFLEQFCGLAGALSVLHTCSPARDDTETEEFAIITQKHPTSSPVPVEVLIEGETTSEGVSVSSHNSHIPWRHGHLNPEAILVSKSVSGFGGWLGTLKLAPLGFVEAKTVLGTGWLRMELKDQKDILRYKAPEAMTSFNDPRSQKSDIWSMGCVILEFIILLLYGGKGLRAFYDEYENEATTSLPGTVYLNPNDHLQGSVQISSIAQRWTKSILKDDECTREGASAFRDLMLLVRDRLLVVDLGLPIGADELQEELKAMLKKAEEMGPCYLFGKETRIDVAVPHILPRRFPAHDLDHVPRNNIQEDPKSQHVRLDKTWDMLLDNNFAIEFFESIKGKTLRFPAQTKCSLISCSDCLRLARMALSTGPFALTFKTNRPNLIERVRAPHVSSCPTRRMVLEACFPLIQDKGDRVKPTAIEIHRLESSLYLTGYSSPILSFCRWPTTGSSSSSFDSFTKTTDLQIAPPELLLDTEPSAYFGLLSSWLRDCDNNHLQCQVRSLPHIPSGSFLPTRLLDVGRSRTRIWLCETSDMPADMLTGDTRYLALSHPWGDGKLHEHFCTTRENLKSRLQNGIVIQDFPRTLRDAVHVAQALDIRYLWIDTVCIIQGNDGDFNTEAKLMELVYSMAYAVIAASRATGMSDGFLFPRPRRRYVVLPSPSNVKGTGKTAGGSRAEPTAQEKSAAIYLCEPIDDFQKDVIDGPLNKRGWVLQERALARRTIYFTQTQTYFECEAGVRCETLTKMTNNQAAFLGDPNFPAVAMNSTTSTKIRLCQSLYETYSSLQFTKPQDRSVAIAGLEQRLSRVFNINGAYGILDGDDPSFFGRTLLWIRDARLQSAMYPIGFDLSSSERGGSNSTSTIMYGPVPTWSWMACEGVITFMDLPFSGVEWCYIEEGVSGPWTALNHNDSSNSNSSNYLGASSTVKHTGHQDKPILRARPRQLKLLRRRPPQGQRDEEGGWRIFHDSGKNISREAGLKCVVVGRRWDNRSRDDWKNRGVSVENHVVFNTLRHYVLLVARRGGRDSAEYVRVGVGSIPGFWIDLDGRGEDISII